MLAKLFSFFLSSPLSPVDARGRSSNLNRRPIQSILTYVLLSFFSALRFPHRKTCLPKVKQDIRETTSMQWYSAGYTAGTNFSRARFVRPFVVGRQVETRLLCIEQAATESSWETRFVAAHRCWLRPLPDPRRNVRSIVAKDGCCLVVCHHHHCNRRHLLLSPPQAGVARRY